MSKIMHRLSSLVTLAALGLFALGLSTKDAAAQKAISRPSRLPALGRSTATADDTSALVLNPANLAFMPASELRWSGIFLDDELAVPWQGHAFGFGFPLPFSFATGVRLDLVDPPDAQGPIRSSNYQWLTWGLAYRLSPNSAIGGSLQHSYSSGSFARDLSSYSLGLSSRPWPWLGFSVVANDFNDPHNSAGFGVGDALSVALAIRPLGNRGLEIGLEGKDLDTGTERVLMPRATLGVDIGPIGRVSGEFSMSDPGDSDERAWLASLGLSIYSSGFGGSSELAAGAVTGNGLGKNDSYNLYSDVALRNWRERTGIEGTPSQRVAVRLRMEDTPDARGHVAWLRELWALAKEPSVDVVVFELKTSPAESLAHVQELRDAIFNLRRHGKRTLCHLEDSGGDALYLCSAANKILLNPAGGLRFSGLRTQHMYFGRLLQKLGIKADFIRIGEHKSAPERFYRSSSTDVSRRDKIDLLQQHERQIVEGVAVGRQLSFAEVRERLATGPFVASEAKAAKFVDQLAFDDELQKAVNDLAGRSVALISNERAPRAPKSFPGGRKLALVYVDGDMVDGRSKTIPLLGMKVEGSYTIAETFKGLRDNPEIGAVVLRIETPGGSSMAADVMWREIKTTAERKPVIVSMGSVAASGGYYIAAPATRIFASPLTITGSIGIFYGKADVSELLGKVGVDIETFKTTPRADAESLFRAFSADERRELERKVGQFYDVFLDRVAQGRRMTKAEVDAVGRGRVWTGEQAKEQRLVDELGGLRQALAHARKLAHLPDDAPIIELPELPSSFLGRLLGIPGLHVSTHSPGSELSASLPKSLNQMLKAVAPFAVHPSDKPLARLEYVLVGAE